MIDDLVNEDSWHDDASISLTDVACVYFSQRDQVFWFADEAEQLNGPYVTKSSAKVALDLYVQHL